MKLTDKNTKANNDNDKEVVINLLSSDDDNDDIDNDNGTHIKYGENSGSRKKKRKETVNGDVRGTATHRLGGDHENKHDNSKHNDTLMSMLMDTVVVAASSISATSTRMRMRMETKTRTRTTTESKTTIISLSSSSSSMENQLQQIRAMKHIKYRNSTNKRHKKGCDDTGTTMGNITTSSIAACRTRDGTELAHSSRSLSHSLSGVDCNNNIVNSDSNCSKQKHICYELRIYTGVGMQFCTNTDNESTNRLVDSLHIGEPNNSYNHKQQQHIILELEPDNQYDPNALRSVLFLFREEEDRQERRCRT